ncbi:MAG: transketolase [Rhodospirillaceae bacterium]|nr:transketolase [Rhodospirillaceae bacterium]
MDELSSSRASNLGDSAQVGHGDLATAIRALAMDAVQRANSGHPGMPMGMADVATVLFSRFLKFDPAHPHWPDRDRFVLSAGHGSMLLYALLYLTGYPGVTIEEIENFRQLGSRTPGHPEFSHTVGVETTTGPLGQGLGNAVGMALAERMMAARFGEELVDHFTYVIAGDGDLMEGISHEAMSLAGHLRLSRLVVLFDDNRISIDGPTSLTVSDDQIARIAAYGWHVQAVDGHEPEQVATAIAAARRSDRPSLIACRTIVGYGAPNKQGTAGTHGSPLGDDEIAAARERMNWPYAPFEIPEAILERWRAIGAHGGDAYAKWEERRAASSAETRKSFDLAVDGGLPEGWEDAVGDAKRALAASPKTIASRKASELALETLTKAIPTMIGGSADLTGSNNTKTGSLTPIGPGDYAGRYVYYGVREHGMAAAMNGMALHGGLIPYGGTFLVFSDYCRPSIRLAALMRQRVVYVMTHDSIGLGEDGPTHQPVEHLAALRAIPNLAVYRPCDAVETLECWALAVANRDGPSLLALSRQNLPQLREGGEAENLCARGGYVLKAPAAGSAKVVLVATGSEVAIASEAREALEKEGVATALVSMPCRELFEAQDDSYRRSVIPEDAVCVVVEAGVRMGWEWYYGRTGAFVGMTGFGESAPYKRLYEHFGITAAAVVEAAKTGLKA